MFNTLNGLKITAKKYSLKIWAYCLMSNHVHFVCVPTNKDSLARTFNALHMRYSQKFQSKKEFERAPLAGKILLLAFSMKDICMQQLDI